MNMFMFDIFKLMFELGICKIAFFSPDPDPGPGQFFFSAGPGPGPGVYYS